jgi:hypothetical protein
VLAVTLGDIFLTAAQAFAALDPKHRRRAAGLLVRACDQYQQAGLSRRARACWRLARFMHRAAWNIDPRPVSPHRRPPTPRMTELADAVERLTDKLGHPPSWRELSDALSINQSTVRDLAARARLRGVVTFTDNLPRSIKAVRGPAR